MGGSDSKFIEDYFVLEHCSKLTLKPTRPISYYWIQQDKNSNQDYMSKLRNYYKTDRFPEIKTLKQQMNFVGVRQIVKVISGNVLSHEDYTYLQSEDKVSEVIVKTDKKTFEQLQAKYSKIKGFFQTIDGLINILEKLESLENLILPVNTLLMMCDNETKMLNRYRLNYNCMTKFQNREKAKQDFIEIAEHLCPEEKKLIQQFKKSYNILERSNESRDQLFDWVFKDSFFWKLTHELPKTTLDPKRLGYLRFSFREIYEEIFLSFKTNKVHKNMFIVIDLNELQTTKISESKDKFIIFTSFVKAYTDKTAALKHKRQSPNAFFFQVMSNRKIPEQSLNFGYYVNQKMPKNTQNVIYNIFNIFRIQQINVKSRSGFLYFGIMSEIFPQRLQKKKRQSLPQQSQNLIRNFDHIKDIEEKYDNQAILLQLSGYFKQSIEYLEKKVDIIRKSEMSEDNVNEYLIKKGDALMLNDQYNQAEESFNSVSSASEKMKLVSLIHLSELYMKTGNQQKLDKIIVGMKDKIQVLKQSHTYQYLKVKNYLALRKLKNGQIKTAKKMYEDLIGLCTSLYPYGHQGKSLFHDIYRGYAVCHSRMGLNKDALDMLKETRSWQVACQGNTPNVALTENLIQSVSSSSGNTKELEESRARVLSISDGIEHSEAKFYRSSVVDTNLRQSIIKIEIN